VLDAQQRALRVRVDQLGRRLRVARRGRRWRLGGLPQRERPLSTAGGRGGPRPLNGQAPAAPDPLWAGSMWPAHSQGPAANQGDAELRRALPCKRSASGGYAACALLSTWCTSSLVTTPPGLEA